MTDDTLETADAAELRCRAEELLREKQAETASSINEAECSRLLYELQVHQVELEMQNAELRHTRDELESALEKYTDLYDFAPVGYFTLDRDSIIREVNLAGALLLGVERSRLKNRSFRNFVSRKAHSVFAAFLSRMFENRGKESCEVALAHRGENRLHVQMVGAFCSSCREVRIAVIDISERKRMEESLEILRTSLADRAAELETANIELEAFNATVAHDLRQPLASISGYSELVKEICGESLDEECLGFLNVISTASLTMTGLIDTLLNFSRILRVPIKHQLFDLGGVARAVARSLATADSKCSVTFRIAEGLQVQGDPGLLEIVLNNLIGNSWKYSDKGDAAVIEVGVTEKEGRQAFFVRDNGPGFDMADADQMFAPFQRLPGTAAQGHGLGLATAERIIRRHGGRIWAESEPGKGATFFFTLQS